MKLFLLTSLLISSKAMAGYFTPEQPVNACVVCQNRDGGHIYQGQLSYLPSRLVLATQAGFTVVGATNAGKTITLSCAFGGVFNDQTCVNSCQ